jgi:hypothetical protein
MFARKLAVAAATVLCLGVSTVRAEDAANALPDLGSRAQNRAEFQNQNRMGGQDGGGAQRDRQRERAQEHVRSVGEDGVGQHYGSGYENRQQMGGGSSRGNGGGGGRGRGGH